MEILKILLYLIIGLLLLFIGLIHVLLYLQIKTLQKQYDLLKSFVEKIESINEIANKNPEFVKKFNEVTGGQTFSSILKETYITVIYDYQNELLEIERRIDFEPKQWWPKKYTDKLNLLKKQVRELILRLRD